MSAHQIEFPLRVAVCAWCKPNDPEAVTHGICPRHLRKLRRESQRLATRRFTPQQLPARTDDLFLPGAA